MGARPPFGPDRPLDASDAARAAGLWAGMIRRERHGDPITDARAAATGHVAPITEPSAAPTGHRAPTTEPGAAATGHRAPTTESGAAATVPGVSDDADGDPTPPAGDHTAADADQRPGHGSARADDAGVDVATGLPRPAAWEVTAARDELARAGAALRVLAAGIWAVGSDDLAGVMESLDALRTGVDAASVMVTREALDRGTVAASQCAGPGQWARANAPSLDPNAAGWLGTVAAACTDQPRHELLQRLVGSGAVTYRVAGVALREAEKITPDLDLDTDLDEVLGWFLAGATAGATVRDLRRLSTWLRGHYGEEKANRDGEKAHGLNHLEASTLPDGVRRYLLHLCPEHAAILDAALAALSGPAPTVDPSTGEQVRDERSAGRRRADALIEIVRRAQAAEAADASATATTKLILTMSLADLLAGTGTARTRESDLLDAGTVRRLACDADLIPAVLGTDSAILDWGRERRLFDGPLRAAIVARDEHCTFPGCGRPATWCQAHHVIHWLEGGKTALLNAALLCQRHHTIVHRDNLTATVTAAGVVWDPTPRAHPPTSPTGYPGGPEPHDACAGTDGPASRKIGDLEGTSRPGQPSARRPGQPARRPGQPARRPDRPVRGSDRPVRGSGQPARRPDRPLRRSGPPVRGSGQPARGSDRPLRRSGPPVRGSGQPVRGSGQPVRGSDQPAPGPDQPPDAGDT